MPTATEVARYSGKGTCIDCGRRPAAPYRKRCAECLEKQRGQLERHRKQKERYALENRCIVCGRPLDEDADKGHRVCINCRELSGRRRI